MPCANDDDEQKKIETKWILNEIKREKLQIELFEYRHTHNNNNYNNTHLLFSLFLLRDFEEWMNERQTSKVSVHTHVSIYL